jgi:hypothetical protein
MNCTIVNVDADVLVVWRYLMDRTHECSLS